MKQLDKQSIRHLCADQVIVTMASVVKELIENALDAESTFIGLIGYANVFLFNIVSSTMHTLTSYLTLFSA